MSVMQNGPDCSEPSLDYNLLIRYHLIMHDSDKITFCIYHLDETLIYLLSHMVGLQRFPKFFNFL